MKRGLKQWGWGFMAAVALAGCSGERELATEHIRQTLEGVEPAAMEVPAAADVEGAGESRQEDGAEPAPDDASSAVQASPVVALADGDTIRIRPAVVDFYRARGFEPAWTGYDELTQEGVRALSALGSLSYDGLDPGRYGFATGQAMAVTLRNGEAGDRKLEQLGDLDILLTESLVRAAADLEEGLIDPEAAGLEWRFERTEASDSAVLAKLAAGEDPRSVLAAVRPRALYYHRLAEGLKRLRAVEARGGWPAVPEGGTLREGDRDARVAALRDRFLEGEDPHERELAKTGRGDPQRFDEDLAAAVRHFQVRHTLHEDGAFGPATLSAVNVPVEDRIETVRLNLDRWRRLPRDLGEEYLLVNVAGFELELVAGDSVIESMSVVVGRTANRTPLFRDSLQYVVVNPYWNVPISIARAEIIPALRRDPYYLERNHYEVLRNNRVVNSYWITPEDLESGRYLIRQRPGPWNALGNMKILFPNDMNIYLHDSPAGHLFSQESRAFSYGCIRVERPADLARTLIERLTDRDGSDYDRLRERTGEQWVTLERQIPIYILYFTAWARADGTLRFHPDVYERDAALAGEREARLPRLVATGGTGTRSTAPQTRSG